jgi:hypothetical protein
MRSTSPLSNSLTLEPFQRLELRDPTNQVELIAHPGEGYSLVIQAPDEMRKRMQIRVQEGTLSISLHGGILERLRDALTTSLTRQFIRLEVSAPSLKSIDVRGWVSVDARAYGNRQPELVRGGPFAMLAPFSPRQ